MACTYEANSTCTTQAQAQVMACPMIGCLQVVRQSCALSLSQELMGEPQDNAITRLRDLLRICISSGVEACFVIELNYPGWNSSGSVMCAKRPCSCMLAASCLGYLHHSNPKHLHNNLEH